MSTVDVGAGVKPPPPTLPQPSTPPLGGSDGSNAGAPVAGSPQANTPSASVGSAAASASSTSVAQSLTLAVAQPTANSTSSSRTAPVKTQGYSVITNSQGAQTTVVVACNPNSESCQSGSPPSGMPKSTLVGAIVGGAIGGLILLSLLGWFLCRRRRRRREANRLEFNYIPDMPSPSPSYSRSHGYGSSPTPSGSRRVMVMPGYAGGDVRAHGSGSMRRTATTSPGPTVGRNPFNTPEAVRQLDSPLATPTTAMTSPRPIWKPTTPAEHKSMRGEIFTPPSPEPPMPAPERVVSATPASPTTWRFDPPSPGGEGDAFFLTPTPPNRRFAPSFRSGYSNNAALSVHGSTHGALSTRTTSTTGSLFPPGFVFGPPPTTPAGTPARPNATFAASTTSVVNPEFPPGFVFGPPPSQRTPATSPLRAEFQLDNLAPRYEDEMTRHSQIGRAW